MSLDIGIGLSTEKDPQSALREAIRQARTSIQSNKASLAIVFSTMEFAYSAVPKAISAIIGDIPLVGCSSLAILTQQGVHKHGLAVALLSFSDGVYFNASCVSHIAAKSAIGAGQELGDKLLYGFKGIRRDLGILFCDGLLPDGSGILSGLQEKLGRSFPIVGGSASDNLAFKKTYLYFKDEALNEATCGVVLGGKFNFGFGAKHGWEPIGKPHVITRSHGNVVYEIDGRPAIELYKEYLAYDQERLLHELKHISIFYPIGIHLPGEIEYLLRNMLSIEADGSIIFQGDVPQESHIRLMIGTKESCLNATRLALTEAKKALAGRPVKFALVFDSVSRYKLLHRDAEKEIKVIGDVIGKDTPFAGIYTFGEQAPLGSIDYHGQAHFHNQTITALAIGG